jgi:hypothetical protein
MFIIDLYFKETPQTLSVQKKTLEDAEATYRQLLDALRADSNMVLELTCDRQPEKRIALLSDELAAVQLSEKTGTATSSGRPPGFMAALSE